jgi:DNA-binding beta-propeller fold protein YncE
VANCGNKLYATAVNAESKQDATGTIESKLNDRLFVFSADDLSLLKTVPIGILAEQLTYVPAVNRLYIAHSSMSEKTPQCIEVLDCEKDKVITKIDVQGFRRMSYVGNHKLYVSCSGGPVFGSGGKGGLLVIDVRNNKIIKKIPGEYAPIAYNFNATEEAK